MRLSDEMHDAVDVTRALAGLQQVDQLFLAIVQHSGYGHYQCVDQAIHRLLLLAVGRCEDMRNAEMQRHAATHGTSVVGWQSRQHADIDEHLEFYRNFLGFVDNHPASCLAPPQDQTLDLARQSLQRLCPRIHGLSRWTRNEVQTARTARNKRAARPAPPSTSQRQPRAERQMKTSPRKLPPRKVPPVPAPAPVAAAPAAVTMMPTPPTQTGDVRLADTMPIPVSTVRLKQLWKPNAAVQPATPVSGAPSYTLGREAVDFKGGAEGAAGPVSRSGFRLRPEHVPSPRCCLSHGVS